MPENNPPPAVSQSPPGPSSSIQLTPELVKKIAARVYVLLLADAQIERERRHFSPQKSHNSDGGRYGA